MDIYKMDLWILRGLLRIFEGVGLMVLEKSVIFVG